MKHVDHLMLIIALGLILSISACQLESLNDPIVVADIENEFYIDMWETAAAVNNLQVLVETIEDETCLNAEIEATSLKRPNAIQIQINDILEPDDCIEGAAPATAQLELGNLPVGIYDFSIELKSTIFNNGQFTVTPERYQLEMESEDGIILVRSQLLRIPKETFWGYVNYEAGAEGLAESFLEDLRTLTIPTNFLRGYYGYFTVNNEVNDVTVTSQPADFTLQSFVHQYERTEQDKIIDLVENYRQEGLEIWLQNDLGELL
ncbi:MAG: hypothetical protein AAF798_03295 [Bacteroidota bacterium]